MKLPHHKRVLDNSRLEREGVHEEGASGFVPFNEVSFLPAADYNGTDQLATHSRRSGTPCPTHWNASLFPYPGHRMIPVASLLSSTTGCKSASRKFEAYLRYNPETCANEISATIAHGSRSKSDKINSASRPSLEQFANESGELNDSGHSFRW
ncbi:hypothetical protein [Azomonas macrocytogenes]|uniref:Uncharacterized protein n=1 Tax=Azomonas macrocytogenes TaxID=69962 RepID=A0A839T730_AZOMA|nr:hypothetical protein [Azomonas macrocytogenes]MBB3104064.1 hypothetical protein [Azomonas macrocytogenes]